MFVVVGDAGEIFIFRMKTAALPPVIAGVGITLSQCGNMAQHLWIVGDNALGRNHNEWAPVGVSVMDIFVGRSALSPERIEADMPEVCDAGEKRAGDVAQTVPALKCSDNVPHNECAGKPCCKGTCRYGDVGDQHDGVLSRL